MRKVTTTIYNAWKAGKSKKVNNTETDGWSVWLHGNCIVKHNDHGYFELFTCGWPTRTTLERFKPFIPLSRYHEIRSKLKNGESVLLTRDEITNG